MTEVLNATRETGRIHSFVSSRKPDVVPWLLGGLALVLGALFVISDLAANQGELIAPLDDVYIHLQYGRQLGLGHFFQFNTGDPISTGASSFLYALILGAAYAIGFQGPWFLAFAVGFNLLCFAAATVLTYLLGSRLVARSVGGWTALLVAVSGPVLWGSSSGMEVGITMLLVVATVLVFAHEAPGGLFVFTPLMGVLLALVRPEGLIFAGFVMVASWWILWTQRHTTGWVRSLVRWPWTVLPLLAGVGQLAFYALATGTTSANGIQSKSLLHDAPLFYLGVFVDRTADNLRRLAGTFLGFTNGDFAFPGALLLFFAGAVYLIVLRRAWRPLFVALAAGAVAVMISVSTLNTAIFHNLRYQQPFLPILLLFAVSGAYGITRAVPRSARRVTLHGGLAVVLVFSLVALPTWIVRFGRDAETIRDTDVSVGAWIAENLPPGVSVGVKDVGAVAYFGRHRVVDLIGLATNGLAAPSNNGIGSLYEAVRQLPPGERPEYFATYDTGPGVSMAPLRDAGILNREPVQRFKMQTPGDVAGNVIVPFPELDIWRTDWTLAGSGDTQQVPGRLRDYVNVGDLRNEAAHAYEPRMAQVGMQPFSIVTRVGDVIDSGRTIAGGEAFTAHDLEPGRPLTITSRTAMDGIVPEMSVFVDGKPAGTWTRTPGTGGWETYTYPIPGSLITGSSAHIEIAQPRPLLNPYPIYNSYGYWLSQ